MVEAVPATEERPRRIDLEALVRRGIQRAACTAGSVTVYHDPKTLSSFDERVGLTTVTRMKPLWRVEDGDGANVTVLGASGRLGRGVLRACRGNPLVGKVTAVVRDVDKAERELRPMFQEDSAEEELRRKGFAKLQTSSAKNKEAADAPKQQLEIVQGDVRRRTVANAAKMPPDDALQAAVSTSDVVINCAAGTSEYGNSPYQVDYLGAVRMANMAAHCDARYVAFTSIKNRQRFHWYHAFTTHWGRPWLHTAQKGLERTLMSDSGKELFPPLHGVPLLWSVAYWEPPVASFKDSTSFLAERGDHFPQSFRFNIFRLGEVLPARMSSNFEMHFNDTTAHSFRHGWEPISPTLAGMIALRSALCMTAQIHHRVDITGRCSKEHGIPSQAAIDAALERSPPTVAD